MSEMVVRYPMRRDIYKALDHQIRGAQPFCFAMARLGVLM